MCPEEVEKNGKVFLHIEMARQERDRLKELRGDQKWRTWLLSLPEQFERLSERIEFYRNKLERAEEKMKMLQNENEALSKRLRKLQGSG